MAQNDSLKTFGRGTFRSKLFALVLVAVLPGLLLALHRTFQHREIEKNRILQEISSFSRLIAANERGYVKNARQMLTTLAGIDFLVQSKDANFTAVHFQNLLKLSPDYLNFGLIESNGALFASGLVLTGSPPLLGDRSYFKRAVATKAFSIGDFQVGRLSNEPSLNFGYPILNKTGGVDRVLFASIKLSLLTAAARDLGIPSGAVATVVDRSGTILARSPNEGNWVGRSMKDADLIKDILRVKEGITRAAGLDGVTRMYAVTPITDDHSASLFVSVGVPVKVLFAQANQTLLRNLLFSLLVMIGALIFSYVFAERLFVKPVVSLLSAAEQLAGGNLTARAQTISSTIELRRLSEEFNTMATFLQNRDHQLRSAHDKIQQMNAVLEHKVLDRTAQLSTVNQELEAFSYSVSHDLRAPLRHLDGFAELLRRHQHDRLDDKGKRYLCVISEAARKMGTLIDELLLFSRMNRAELAKQRVDMDSLVQECIAQLSSSYATRKIEWKVSKLPQVTGDQSMLRQVWLNLISNAIKYTGPREIATIDIRAEEQAEEYVFSVRDNGVGFDMKYADKLFGVFQRLHRESEFEGTGIGLANVRRIINRHGGRTWAQSTVDVGTTFYFSVLRDEYNTQSQAHPPG